MPRFGSPFRSWYKPRLVELGYRALAIGADRPGKVRETHEKSDFRCRLLSDSTMEAARAFGIEYNVEGERKDARSMDPHRHFEAIGGG